MDIKAVAMYDSSSSLKRDSYGTTSHTKSLKSVCALMLAYVIENENASMYCQIKKGMLER
jgi:hypothetical protein